MAVEQHCGKCRKAPCVELRYSRTLLCPQHFFEMFEQRFRRTVREFGMIMPNDHVAVALSGGKDSTVLMHLLARLKKRLPMKLSAILVDEGIAGYRPHTVKTAKAECRKLGIPLHIVSFEKEFGKKLDAILAARGRGNSAWGACTYCGVFRRTLLNRAALKIKADKLAIGHNLDDAAQTLLMNLMRNEPSRLARFGISGGVAEGGNLVMRIKPLIRSPEKEVALWAELHGIGIHHMQCPYANEALRQEVRRMLNSLEEKYPGTKFRIFSSFLSIKPALVEIAKKGGLEIPTCPSCGDASSGGKCAACKLLDGITDGGLGKKRKN